MVGQAKVADTSILTGRRHRRHRLEQRGGSLGGRKGHEFGSSAAQVKPPPHQIGKRGGRGAKEGSYSRCLLFCDETFGAMLLSEMQARATHLAAAGVFRPGANVSWCDYCAEEKQELN